MTSKIVPFVLPNGETAGLKRVSQELFLSVGEANQPPPPPMNRVERPDGTYEDVPNPADPVYQAVVSAHNGAMALKLRDFLVSRALVFALNDEMKAEVADLRADMASMGVTLSTNDKVVYYVHIACSTIAESMQIIQAVQEAWGVSGPKSTSGSDASTSVSTASEQTTDGSLILA